MEPIRVTPNINNCDGQNGEYAVWPSEPSDEQAAKYASNSWPEGSTYAPPDPTGDWGDSGTGAGAPASASASGLGGACIMILLAAAIIGVIVWAVSYFSRLYPPPPF